MLTKAKIVDVRDKITAKLKEPDVDRSLRWLAIKAGINYRSLHCCIIEKRYFLSDENLKKINDILETSFKNTAPKTNK